MAQTRQVLDLIRRLREQGLAVIVISHNLEDVFSVVDRIKVLRLGRNGGRSMSGTSTREQVVSAITGAKFGYAEQEVASAIARAEGDPNEYNGKRPPLG